MDPSLNVYLIGGAVLVGFIVLGMMKGMIKMLLFGAGALGGILSFLWMQRNGFGYLSFLTNEPKPWMADVLSWTTAILVFAVFTHGLFWFSNVFSWGKKMGFGGVKGVLTTVLMVCVLMWVSILGISYFGSIAQLNYVHELALHQMGKGDAPVLALAGNAKKAIYSHVSTEWLKKIDIVEDPERLVLAQFVCYLGTLDSARAVQIFNQLIPYVPRPRRIWNLAQDSALRSIIQGGDMATLLADPKLTTFLTDPLSRASMNKVPRIIP